MKRLISLIVIFALAACSLISCSGDKKYDYPFVNVIWTRVTESDTEYIRFSSNGEFSYYSYCGNPVNDSDLCTGYTYDSETNVIKLKYSETTDETVAEIKVVKCTKEELVLDFGGDVRTFTVERETSPEESVTHGGRKYVLIEYPADIFYYELTYSPEREDVIYDVVNDKWGIIAYNGESYVLESQAEEIRSYLNDDGSFEWYIAVEDPESDNSPEKPLMLTDGELDFLRSLTDPALDTSVSFDDIQIFATLIRRSKDGLFIGKTDLLYYGDAWYWRSETVDESKEGWPEYVVALPDSLQEKLASVLNSTIE